MHVVGLTHNSTMVRVLAVASAKGGVGKTTTTAALGVTLAETDSRVVVVDTDLGMANLATALGVDADGATVHDVLAGQAEPAAATYEGPAGLAVVPGDTDLAAFPDADPANLRTVLDAFDDADYVLLDTGAGLSHDTVLPLGLADEVVLVTDTDPNAVGDTEKTRQVVDRLGGSVAGVVVTQVDSAETDGDAPDVPDVVDAIDAPVLGTVPASPLVGEAETDDPFSLSDPDSPVAAAYRRLARELTNETIPEPASDARTADTTASNDDTDAEPPSDSEPVVSEESDATETTDDDEIGKADDGTGEDDEADVAVQDAPENPLTEDEHSSESSDHETLVPDAEEETPPTTSEAAESDEDDGVYTTSLVDEAEVDDTSAESGDPGDVDDGTEVADDSADATEEEDDDSDDDGGRSGLLGRLLG